MTKRRLTRRQAVALGIAGVAGMLDSTTRDARAAGAKKPVAAEVLPLAQVPDAHRASVVDVIENASFHRKGEADTFPANPKIYLKLVNEPTLTLALWQDLANSPAQLQQVGPDRYAGTDGNGTNATWEFLVRTPQLHALFCDLDYAGPRGGTRLQGRLLLVVRSAYFKEVNGEFWVKHEVEIFAKVDSRGWRAVAATLKPVLERVLKDQVDEAGLFVSLMSRLVEVYPDWAAEVARTRPGLTEAARAEFAQLINETRRPGAFAGRPVMADASTRRTSGERR